MNRIIAFFVLKKNTTYVCSKDGVEYIMSEHRTTRYKAKLLSWVQLLLWKLGVNIHNPLTSECTPDFRCCLKRKEK